jgi:hypothetical protein
MAEKVLTWVWCPLIAAGVFLGVPGRYTHRTVDANARELLLPAGVLLIIHAWIFYRRRSATLTSWATIFGVALVGVGAWQAFGGPWTLLALPLCALGGLAFLRGCVKGPGSGAYEFCRGARPSCGGPRLMCFGLVVLFWAGAVLAIMPVVHGR